MIIRLSYDIGGRPRRAQLRGALHEAPGGLHGDHHRAAAGVSAWVDVRHLWDARVGPLPPPLLDIGGSVDGPPGMWHVACGRLWTWVGGSFLIAATVWVNYAAEAKKGRQRVRQPSLRVGIGLTGME